MGKVNNERRKQLFKELKESGKLARPVRPKQKPKKPPVVKESFGCYCRDKYRNVLPPGWRACADCPLT